MRAITRASDSPMAKDSAVKMRVLRAARVAMSGNWSQKMSPSRNAWWMRVQSAMATSQPRRPSVAA
jgi:hypothetical protein